MLETPLCEIGSTDDLYYLPFLTLSDDGVFNFPFGFVAYPITLPQPLPLGIGVDVAMYTTAYVSYKLIIIRACHMHELLITSLFMIIVV